MLGRLFQFVTTAAAVGALYAAYAWLAVPWLEPAVPARSTGTLSALPAPVRRPYEHLFAEGAWERDRPKVLAVEQGALFVQEYRALEDGKLELKPCTLVLFTAEQDVRTEDGPGRPIVLQAPEGAVLQFDGGADLSQARVGRLIGGRLTGEITIHSPPLQPGGDDELLITTRNLQMDEQRIWTTHEVKFRFGPNTGSGRDLVITLQREAAKVAADLRKKAARAVKSMELVHLQRLDLRLPGGGRALQPSRLLPPRGGGRPAGPADPAPAAPLPVQVTCQGPFQFDFEERVATFHDQVDVLALGQDGPSDQLNCERLEIFFALPAAAPEKARKEEVPAAGPASTAGPYEPPLEFEPARIVARGFPVVLRVPSLGATVRGEVLEYDFQTRRVHVVDRERVFLQERRGTLEAPWFEYEFSEAGGLGRLLAAGPGICRGQLETGQRRFEVSWKGQLAIQPQEGNQVITLKDEARIAMEGAGQLQADELHAFLLEQAAPPERAAQASPAGSGSLRWSLDRLLARGNVWLESPQLTNRSQELHVWFRQPDPSVKPLTRRLPPARVLPAAHAGGPESPANARPAAGAPSYALQGRLVQLEVRLGQPPVVERASIEGEVQFRQTAGEQAEQGPFVLSGDTFQLEDGGTTNPKARVVGRPAQVAARGMQIQGANLQLLQGDNLMWITGHGEMTMPRSTANSAADSGRPDPSGAAPAAPSGLQDAHISWRQAMQFDGTTIQFRGDVQTQGTLLTRGGERMEVSASSESLTATLSHRISFLAPRPSAELAARAFRFDGSVLLQNRSSTLAGNPRSFDELRCPNLSLDQQTGEIRSDGAGRIWTVREATQQATLLPQGLQKQAPREGLSYLQVDFQEGIRGDLHRREVKFIGDVKTIYGPVHSWNDRLDPDSPAGLGDDGVMLTSRELAVREMGTVADPAQGRGRPAFELEAWGDAKVVGKQFSAWAEHLAYAQAKDQLMLEGSGRNDAVLTRYTQPNASPSVMRFRKILFWPKTGAFDIQDAATISVPNLSQFQEQ